MIVQLVQPAGDTGEQLVQLSCMCIPTVIRYCAMPDIGLIDEPAAQLDLAR